MKFFRISEGPVPASRDPACLIYKHQPVSSDRDVIICLFDGKRKHMNGLMGGWGGDRIVSFRAGCAALLHSSGV